MSRRIPASTLKVLLATAVPPPDHGGMAAWTRCLHKTLAGRTDIQLAFVDTSMRRRSIVNVGLFVRIATGVFQAALDICRVYRQFRENRPDVFHLCTSGRLAPLKDLVLLLLARLFRVPSVIHYHMGRLPWVIRSRGLEGMLARRVMPIASTVVVLDQESEAATKLQLPWLRIVRIPNMIDVAEIDGIVADADSKSTTEQTPTDAAAKPGEPCEGARDRVSETHAASTGLRVVFVGQVLPTKGARELAAACAGMADPGPTLDIVGPVTPAFRAELEKIAETRQDGRWLRFHGCVDHAAAQRQIAAADIVALPSYTEGFPYVVLEAMACSRAIVGTRVGAVPEMLGGSGRQACGICVEPRDAAALQEALARLSADSALRERLGREARSGVERDYSAPAVCLRLMELWRSVAFGSGLPPAAVACDRRNRAFCRDNS
jgi:glycosyltransferase involved in cell wall biosynthesis